MVVRIHKARIGSRNSLTGGGAQIRPHPAVAMALILTVVDN